MMSEKASLRWQWWAASCGILFAILYGVFWGLFGHNIPPASPALSPADLAAFYIQNHRTILFGESMAAFVGVLYAPWTAQMTITLWRIEGASPVLAICVLIGGTLTTWVVMFCPALWAACAYRTDINPQILRTLNDAGFIVFNITYMSTTMQAILMGAAGLIDKSEHRVFPAWVSWWGILTGVSFLPITALPFYTSGPVAWDGLITFWMGFATFFVWLLTAGWYMAAEATRRSRLAAGYVRPVAAALHAAT